MKKTICLLLAVVLLFAFAACSTAEEPVTSTAPPPVFSSSAASSMPEPEPLNPAFLTGLAKDANYPEGQRICAIMVNNIADSRPQRGTSEADIVFEIVTEGGITRLMCLFSDYKSIPMTGPIRSARDQFFQFIIPFWPFYIHDGQSQPTGQMIKDFEYAEFNLDTGIHGGNTRDKGDLSSLAWRDADRLNRGYAWEYTEYTDGEHIASIVQSKELDDYRSYGTFFNFMPYDQPPRIPKDGAATEITVVHSPRSYMSYFEYDAAAGRYRMSMYNTYRGTVDATIDENNNTQLAFDNLVVLFAPMEMYPTTYLPKFDYYGGVGYYISQGSYELIRWGKGSPNAALQLYDFESHEPLLVNPGKTYVGIVNDSLLPDFHEVMQTGAAGKVIGEGDIDTSAVDMD